MPELCLASANHLSYITSRRRGQTVTATMASVSTYAHTQIHRRTIAGASASGSLLVPIYRSHKTHVGRACPGHRDARSSTVEGQRMPTPNSSQPALQSTIYSRVRRDNYTDKGPLRHRNGWRLSFDRCSCRAVRAARTAVNYNRARARTDSRDGNGRTVERHSILCTMIDRY